MNTKLLVLGTVAGALTLFAWESLSNTVIPWHDLTRRAFPDSNAAVQAIKANAPENGMYVDARGIVAAVSFNADLSTKESKMGVMLARQLALDVVVALIVLLAFMPFPRLSTRQYALLAAAMALAVSLSVFVSDWNWYGFGTAWSLVNTIDRTVGYALVGLVLGAVINRRGVRSGTDEWNGVRTHPGMPSTVGSTPPPTRARG